MKKMAILGCGNMARALCLGAPNINSLEVYTFTPSQTKALSLAKEVGGNAVKQLPDIPSCDYYLIGCKPQQFDELANKLINKIPKDALIISMMASKSIQGIKGALNHEYVLRVMPNLSVARKKGINLIHPKSLIDSHMESFFDSGMIHYCESEEELDDITLFSGCGPGVLAEILSQVEKSYKKVLGIDSESSNKMLLQLLDGLLDDLSYEPADEYVDRVCSKGGVTEQIVMSLREKGLSQALERGLERAKRKNDQLK